MDCPKKTLKVLYSIHKTKKINTQVHYYKHIWLNQWETLKKSTTLMEHHTMTQPWSLNITICMIRLTTHTKNEYQWQI